MGLPTFVRVHDLIEAGIVASRPQLDILIRDHGFPQSRLLSPRIRAWDMAEVNAWIDSRPVGKVEEPGRGIIRQQRQRRELVGV